MKLVFIYGPPASGKLTTAKELVKITGFRLFHNHLCVDLATSIFDFGTEDFSNFCYKLYIDTIEAAIKAHIKGMTFTFCYGNPYDNPFVERVIEIVEKHNREIYFVQLHCNKAELEKRVLSSDREAFGKVKNVEALREIMNKWDLLSAIPHKSSLSIDNSYLSAEEVAKIIKEHYKL
jgi:tRNA uridine 5-carbamoylmethylation protein Kti12